MLTMLSSTYHFLGVHNLYQAKSAKLNIGEQGKVGLFFLFHYSFFSFHFSLFVFHFWFFVFRFSYSFFAFRFLVFTFRFPFFFDIQNWAEYLPYFSLSYFDIRYEAEYSIFTFKILF